MSFEHEVLICSLWLVLLVVILLLFATGVCSWHVVLVNLCSFGLVAIAGCRWFCDGAVCLPRLVVVACCLDWLIWFWFCLRCCYCCWMYCLCLVG